MRARWKGSSIIMPISWMPNRLHETSVQNGIMYHPSSPTRAMGAVRQKRERKRDVCRAYVNGTGVCVGAEGARGTR